MTLYIIPTPIGNIEDVSIRMLKTIENCDLLLCEDTRRTRKLLTHYKISKKMISFNEQKEKLKTSKVIEELKKDKIIGLISDSGTPLINDPGYILIREAIQENIKIVGIPGPSAFLMALVLSGFPIDKFIYWGFLSKKQNKRKEELTQILLNNITTVIYESPYRIEKSVNAIKELEPDRNICICRELTKKFEQVIRGKAIDVNATNIKGEICLVISRKK